MSHAPCKSPRSAPLTEWSRFRSPKHCAIDALGGSSAASASGSAREMGRPGIVFMWRPSIRPKVARGRAMAMRIAPEPPASPDRAAKCAGVGTTGAGIPERCHRPSTASRTARNAKADMRPAVVTAVDLAAPGSAMQLAARGIDEAPAPVDSPASDGERIHLRCG